MKSIEELKQLAEDLGVVIEAAEDVSILAQGVQAGGLTIPNSLAVHPMEGCDGDSEGRPEKLTFRRYERFAAGGAGLLWAEAIAIVEEGRANPRQLWLHENTAERFSTMVRRARAAAKSWRADHNPVIVAQLTHSGRYSKPHGLAHPLIPQRDPYRDPLTPQQKPDCQAKSKLPDDWPIITDDYLDNLVDNYVEAAKLAFKAGFDAVDVKSCHGYLINELLASRKRDGKYGGAFENRTRFLLAVIDGIRAELGEDKPITARLGIYDAIPYPYGWGVDENDYTKPDLTEPKKLIALMRERGVRMINITVANPYYNPHYGRPFNQPIVSGYESPEHPLAGVARMIELTGEIQKEFPDVAIVGTGYSWLRTLLPNVAAAAKKAGKITLAGAGRMAFAYPDFARDIIDTCKMNPKKVCVACSACTQIMRDGSTAGCVIRDKEVYGPIFRAGRMSARENLVRLASSCLQCRDATCTLECPAGVDIPRFISLFRDGKDREAYEVIRQVNILPEICAWLCPVESQCQGGCLQSSLGDGSLPIARIQQYLAEKANKNGWSKVKVPEEATGKRVAILGAGPAGLAAAAVLLEEGHAVTVFDRSDTLGGIVASIIPADRQGLALEHEISAIFEDVPEERMTLRLNTSLDSSFNLDSILAEGFDAAFVGMGLSKSLETTDEKLDGLYNAMEFLSLARIDKGLDLAGKCVAVIGGGNTAMDAAVRAKQLGAKDVYVIYRRSFAEMPAWDAERDRALNDGVHFMILTQVAGFDSTDGVLRGVRLCPTRLGEADESGRRKPITVESSEYALNMDVVVEAIGQKAQSGLESVLPGVEFEGGLVKTGANSFATSRAGVFAAGDIVTGPLSVVGAVSDAMKAAREIDCYLRE